MVGARVRSKEGKGTGEMRVGVEDARQLDRQTATQAAIEGTTAGSTAGGAHGRA